MSVESGKRGSIAKATQHKQQNKGWNGGKKVLPVRTNNEKISPLKINVYVNIVR